MRPWTWDIKFSACIISIFVTDYLQNSEPSLFSPLNFGPRQHIVPSDIESASEVEDSVSGFGALTKEDLYHYYKKMQRRSEKYKGKFSQVSRSFYVLKP